MKQDIIYPYYLTYLNDRLNEGKISSGAFSILKMSRSPFDDFKYRFENDETFNNKIIKMQKSEIRDKKIDDLFDDIN